MNRRPKAWLLAALALSLAAALLFLLREPEPRAEPRPPATQRAAPSPAPAAAPTSEPPQPVREPAPTAPRGELTGRVISTDTRAGIANAELTWSSARGAHSLTTGPDGTFTFAPPEAGAYQLASAKADGYLPFGPEWGKSPISIELRANLRVRGITVELTPAPDITGRVVDAKGQPVPGATARVLVPRRDEIALFPMRDRFTTDARGEFVFRAEPYAIVEAFHPSLGSGSERLERGAKELVITLEPGPADAGARASLSGRVVNGGQPVIGALVHVSSALKAYPRVYGSQDGYRELTDDDGRFELTDLQPGTYDVSAHQLGLAPAHRFEVPVPGEALVLELGSGPKLTGHVSDERGGPVAAFELSLRWKKAPLEQLEIVEATFIDPDGRYAIEGIAPGTYALQVRAAGFTNTITPVTIAQAGDTTADVTLYRGVRASGTVRSAGTRAPIAGAKVALEGDARATVTDASGAFALDGLSRDGFSLQVSAAGHNTRVATVTDPSQPIAVELTPVEPDAGVKTELVGIGAVLRGRGDALVIGQVMPKGGAAMAGLTAGDEVVAVDGKAVAELGFEPSIRAIRGPAETPVVLSIRKQAARPPVDVIATRRKISN